jgi:hypothetical protein
LRILSDLIRSSARVSWKKSDIITAISLVRGESQQANDECTSENGHDPKEKDSYR